MSKKIEGTVFIKAKPNKTEEIKSAILDLIEKTVKEPGCEIFKVFQNKENPDEFILWEVFQDQAAMQEHMEKEYTKHYFSLDLSESSSGIKQTELSRS